MHLTFQTVARTGRDFITLHRTGKKPLHFGLIASKGAMWVGYHYSAYNRRVCINILPGLTFWVVTDGGNIP